MFLVVASCGPGNNEYAVAVWSRVVITGRSSHVMLISSAICRQSRQQTRLGELGLSRAECFAARTF